MEKVDIKKLSIVLNNILRELKKKHIDFYGWVNFNSYNTPDAKILKLDKSYVNANRYHGRGLSVMLSQDPTKSHVEQITKQFINKEYPGIPLIIKPGTTLFYGEHSDRYWLEIITKSNKEFNEYVKQRELEHLIENKVRKYLEEAPYGPQGYFPPVGADPYKSKSDYIEKIYKAGIAVQVAKELKKLIDEVNKKFEANSINRMLVPVLNYYPSTRQGNLILGVAKTTKDKSNRNDNWKTENTIFRPYESKIKLILSKGGTPIYEDFHAGISGEYHNINWTSGIVYSIVTPGRKFGKSTEDELKSILYK